MSERGRGDRGPDRAPSRPDIDPVALRRRPAARRRPWPPTCSTPCPSAWPCSGPTAGCATPTRSSPTCSAPASTPSGAARSPSWSTRPSRTWSRSASTSSRPAGSTPSSACSSRRPLAVPGLTWPIRAHVAPAYGADGGIDGLVVQVFEFGPAGAPPPLPAGLAEVLEEGSDFLLTAGPDGRLSYGNKSAREVLGVRVVDGAAHLEDVLETGSLEYYREIVEPQVFAEGSWQGELTFRARQGRAVPVSARIVAHRPDRLGRGGPRSAPVGVDVRPRHHRAEDRRAQAAPAGHPRLPHRPAEPTAPLRSPRARPQPVRPLRHDGRAHVLRPRRLQAGERPLRPPRRRRRAHRGRRPHPLRGPRHRHRGAPRWRRVRRAGGGHREPRDAGRGGRPHDRRHLPADPRRRRHRADRRLHRHRHGHHRLPRGRRPGGRGRRGHVPGEGRRRQPVRDVGPRPGGARRRARPGAGAPRGPPDSPGSGADRRPPTG